jgi:hypothetical protein
MKTLTQLTAIGVMLPIALAATPRHITPTVVLRKQSTVIRALLPGAQHYFVRSVEIGKDDLNRLRETGFKVEDPDVKFYYGTSNADQITGVVLFPQVSTRDHGPLELGMAIGPDGAIRSVTVTKATVETKPWVLEVLDTDYLSRFEGMRFGDDPATALSPALKSELSSMPYYIAEVLAVGVKRGLALHHTLFASASSSNR